MAVEMVGPSTVTLPSLRVLPVSSVTVMTLRFSCSVSRGGSESVRDTLPGGAAVTVVSFAGTVDSKASWASAGVAAKAGMRKAAAIASRRRRRRGGLWGGFMMDSAILLELKKGGTGQWPGRPETHAQYVPANAHSGGPRTGGRSRTFHRRERVSAAMSGT